MVNDLQESIYKEIMLPSLKTLIQTELTGMPMHDDKIAQAKSKLIAQKESCLQIIVNSDAIKQCEQFVQQNALEVANAKLKTKQHTIDKFSDLKFNPNSGPQVQTLLYEVLGLPVLDKTDTGQPATGGDTIKKLFNHCKPEDKELLKALLDYSEAEKILSTYIPSFETSFLKQDGIRYLHGSYKIGGTVSGRLSATGGLQTLPSNSVFGKTIKECFAPPEGWLFCFADFNALESRIDALTTRDPEKLGVYTDGYDSHAYNTLTYWPNKMLEVAAQMRAATTASNFFLVEYSDGTKEYVCK
jgi:DNA polymerase-1